MRTVIFFGVLLFVAVCALARERRKHKRSATMLRRLQEVI